MLTESAAKLLEAFAAIMMEMNSFAGTRSVSGGATTRLNFRTLRQRALNRSLDHIEAAGTSINRRLVWVVS